MATLVQAGDGGVGLEVSVRALPGSRCSVPPLIVCVCECLHLCVCVCMCVRVCALTSETPVHK